MESLVRNCGQRSSPFASTRIACRGFTCPSLSAHDATYAWSESRPGIASSAVLAQEKLKRRTGNGNLGRWKRGRRKRSRRPAYALSLCLNAWRSAGLHDARPRSPRGRARERQRTPARRGRRRRRRVRRSAKRGGGGVR
eukprot:1601122-Rhodomonas_salina.1